jgi:hypothetical protein
MHGIPHQLTSKATSAGMLHEAVEHEQSSQCTRWSVGEPLPGDGLSCRCWAMLRDDKESAYGFACIRRATSPNKHHTGVLTAMLGHYRGNRRLGKVFVLGGKNKSVVEMGCVAIPYV